MINVKEAVKRAFVFLADIYDKEPLREPRLEEVALSDDANVWLVTVSFVRPTTVVDAAESLTASGVLPGFERDYKVIEIWSQDGEVRSMKIRQLA